MSALSAMTFKEFEAAVRADTGANDYSDPNTTTIMRWTNVILQKIALLTGAIDGAWGRNTATLTLNKAAGVKVYPSGGGSYTAATNALLTGAGYSNGVNGGWVFFADVSAGEAYMGLIDTNPGAGGFILRVILGTAAEANIADANLLVLQKSPPVYYNGANINSTSPRDIVKIVDGTNGNLVRVDGDVFASFASNPNYDSSILSEYAGNSIFIDKGTSVSAFGTLTLTYKEKPTVLTASADNIDILPEHLSALRAEVDRWVLNYMSKPIPQELENPLAALTEKFKKHAQDLAHKMRRDVPARRSA